jgi:hypothetical protein
MKRKFKLGSHVVLSILDHSSHTPEQIGHVAVDVIGRVVGEDKDYVQISTWFYTDPNQPLDHNCEMFSIIKNTIKHCRKLR